MGMSLRDYSVEELEGELEYRRDMQRSWQECFHSVELSGSDWKDIRDALSACGRTTLATAIDIQVAMEEG